MTTREPARNPADLADFFIARANAGDVDGVVALYEPMAVLALPNGKQATGHAEIRVFYQQLLASRPTFAAGNQQPPLRNRGLALTSTRLTNGATAEVARQQTDGTWLWAIDQPNITN